MNKQSPPWILLATLIASGGLTAIAQAFASALPQGATLIANIVAIIVAIAGFVVTYYQAVNTPPPFLNSDTPIKDDHGTIVGTNVSTSSTLPIVAPQKGSTPT